MKERPILFSAPMVRAILEGQKTQTRRVVKSFALEWLTMHNGFNAEFVALPENHLCPYGQPGDRLWVREAWSQPTTLDPGPTFYRADYPQCVPAHFQNVPPEDKIRWKPSIHMKRADSRILLEISRVRVERLQDISRDDAIAEGAPPSHPSIDRVSSEYGFSDFSRSWYAQLWEQINGAGSWAANPWVWVVEFKWVQ